MKEIFFHRKYKKKIRNKKEKKNYIKKQNMFPPGIEPGTFCVLDRCDNHYTTETGI